MKEKVEGAGAGCPSQLPLCAKGESDPLANNRLDYKKKLISLLWKSTQITLKLKATPNLLKVTSDDPCTQKLASFFLFQYFL
jgi:hypothetical protein